MEKSDIYDRVLARTQKVKVVFENDNVLAFHHTRPSYPFHIVIIPKKKILDFMDIGAGDAQTILDVFAAAQEILKGEDFATKGFKIVTNAGTYQESGHLHFHLISGPAIR